MGRDGTSHSTNDTASLRAEGDPFVREDRDFIDAVQGKANKIRASYRDALETHRVTTAASRSARNASASD